MPKSAAPWMLSLVLSAGCSDSRFLNPGDLPFVYKIDVQQGNVVTQDMLAQLEPGMDKSKVRFIMGTPIVLDVFHQDRWDYIYTFQPGGGERVERRLSLFFKYDRLVKVTGDVKPAAGQIAREPRREVTVDIPAVEERGFVSRLKSTIGLGKPPEDKTIEDTARETERTAGVNPADEAGTLPVGDRSPISKEKGARGPVGTDSENAGLGKEPPGPDPTPEEQATRASEDTESVEAP